MSENYILKIILIVAGFVIYHQYKYLSYYPKMLSLKTKNIFNKIKSSNYVLNRKINEFKYTHPPVRKNPYYHNKKINIPTRGYPND